jgi:hypothetical protein
MRIKRSLDTCSRSSFRIAVTLDREVAARFAISAWVMFSRGNFLELLQENVLHLPLFDGCGG